jgi:RNA polymerase sigma-70 factor (ECF subfamily)
MLWAMAMPARRRRQARSGLQPIHGADRIARFFAGVLRKNSALATVAARPATVNGLPGFVLREDDGSIDTMAIEHRDSRIVAIYLTRDPEKLRHVRF